MHELSRGLGAIKVQLVRAELANRDVSGSVSGKFSALRGAFLQSRVYRINLHRVNAGRNSPLTRVRRAGSGEAPLCVRDIIFSVVGR